MLPRVANPSSSLPPSTSFRTPCGRTSSPTRHSASTTSTSGRAPPRLPRRCPSLPFRGSRAGAARSTGGAEATCADPRCSRGAEADGGGRRCSSAEQQGSGASVHGAGEGSGRDKWGGGASAFLGAVAPRPSIFDSKHQFC